MNIINEIEMKNKLKLNRSIETKTVMFTAKWHATERKVKNNVENVKFVSSAVLDDDNFLDFLLWLFGWIELDDLNLDDDVDVDDLLLLLQFTDIIDFLLFLNFLK